MSCSECGKQPLLPLRHEKWGRCPHCIVLALAGTLTGWSFTLAFAVLDRRAHITFVLAAVAAFFTVILALHGIAYRRARPLTKSNPGPNP